MSEIHEEVKFGDLIYIQLSDGSKGSESKFIFSEGFSLNEENYLLGNFISAYSEITDTVNDGRDNSDIHKRNYIEFECFEKNLFIIFPQMSEKFLINKSFLDEKVQNLLNNIQFSPSLVTKSTKEINSIISKYQEIKKEVYKQNLSFGDFQIGRPIKFQENFVLIHLKSQMLVTTENLHKTASSSYNSLNLSDNYSENCIFQFFPYNKFDQTEGDVFCTQNIYIRKSEKNLWPNNPFLYYNKSEKNRTNLQGNNSNSKNRSKIFHSKVENIKLQVTDEYEKATPFQIKKFSDYIDPSSGNLSFTTLFWMVCHNADRYLILNIDDKTDSLIISFAPVDHSNSIHNINGLFSAEEVDFESQNISESSPIQFKIEPYISYNKIVRLRHKATDRYLSFHPVKNYAKNSKAKTFGTLKLETNPSPNCNWVFMESYKILDRELYEQAKLKGLSWDSVKSDRNRHYSSYTTVKKKDILRIFHLESGRFFSFEDLIETKQDHHDKIDKEEFNYNLSLNKLPLDYDLVKLSPSNENQSWEIQFILNVKNMSKSLIDICVRFLNNLIKKPVDGGEILSKNIYENYSGTGMIENLNKWKKLMTCFVVLKDFCLNQYSQRYDYNVSVGKPVHYRQNILKEQEIIKIALDFLKSAKNPILDFLDVTSKRSSMKIVNRDQEEKQTFQINLMKKTNLKDSKLNVVKLEKFNSAPSDMKFSSEDKKQSIKDSKDLLKGIKNSSISIEKESEKNSNINNIPQTSKKISKHTSSDFDFLLNFEKQMKNTITQCFEFLSAVCKSNPINKSHLFENRNIFWDYFLNFQEAAQCLMNIIKDNEDLMSQIIQDEQSNLHLKGKSESNKKTEENNLIDKLINYLNDEKTYDRHTLLILSQLMKSKDKGITSIQNSIYERIFLQKKDKFLLKIKPKHMDTEITLVYRNENGEHESRSLLELCNSKNTLSDYKRNIVQYFSTQLDLYSDMCFERNYVCIERISELFPLEHLIYHISNIDIQEEILASLINILNYVYIDRDPHSLLCYPSMIKIVEENYKIKKLQKNPIVTNIPLDKLNLILCISLFILYNIKYEKMLVNSSNINLLFNLISFRLYENVTFDSNSGKNENLLFQNSIHNLKEDVKNSILEREKNLGENIKIKANNLAKSDKENVNENFDSFFWKIGHKFFESSNDHEIGKEYLIYVLNYFNEFFLEKIVIENIDSNMENKTMIAETFQAINRQDVFTVNNMNHLMKVLTQIKQILTAKYNHKDSYTLQEKHPNNSFVKHSGNKFIIPIIKQMAKVIDFIFKIKINDTIDDMIENLLSETRLAIKNSFKKIFLNMDVNPTSDGKQNIVEPVPNAYEIIKREFEEKECLSKILMDSEYYLYSLFNTIGQESNQVHETKKMPKLEKFSSLSKFKKLIGSKSIFSKKPSLENKINLSNLKSSFELDNNNLNKDYSSDYHYLNFTIFKSLQELVIQMLTVNVDETLLKILTKMFTNINSQRKEVINCLKTIHLIYSESDIKKYESLEKIIKKLSIATEQTEIWMKESESSDPLQDVLKNLMNFNRNEEESNFLNVNNYLNSIYKFFICETSYSIKIGSELVLIQTICFSLQLDNVLFSLLREIIREYPQDSEKRPNKKYNPKIVFKDKLKLIISNLMKVLYCMVYRNTNFQEAIQYELVSYNIYEYLADLGYWKILAHIVSYNSEFALKHSGLIMGIITRECNANKFKEIFKNFTQIENLNQMEIESKNKNKLLVFNWSYASSNNNNEEVTKNENDEMASSNIKKKSIKSNYINRTLRRSHKMNIDRKNFEEELNKVKKLLKLINGFLKTKKEEKHLSQIVRLYEKIVHIIKKNENFVKINSNDVSKNFQTIISQKMQILCELIKMGYNLININERLKSLIRNIFPLEFLDKIKKLKLNIDPNKFDEILCSEKDYDIKESNQVVLINETKLSKRKFENIQSSINYHQSVIKNFFGIKYYGCVFLNLTSYDLQRKIDWNKIKSYFDILDDDLETFKSLRKVLKNYDHKTELIVSFKKSAYKYFFQGFFPIALKLSKLISPELFFNDSEMDNNVDDLKEIIKKYRYVFGEFLNDANQNEYRSTVEFILKQKSDFKEIFSSFELSNFEEDSKSTAIRLDKIFTKIYHDKKEKPKLSNFTNYSQEPQENQRLLEKIKLYSRRYTVSKLLSKFKDSMYRFSLSSQEEMNIVLVFAEDMTSNIENFELTKNYLEKEYIILAQMLKSKINFNQLFSYYINNNSSLINYSSSNFNLLNIFLKFIQENYNSSKSYSQITFLIKLFAHFISCSPHFLADYETSISNFYFDKKYEEINEVCLKYCQNIFLKNGSVEVFLKIICEGSHSFDQTIFHTILHFFNMVLERGNSDSQQKFYDLFTTFTNSELLFYNMKQTLDFDKCLFLKHVESINDLKTDQNFHELIYNQLKFLQQLTEKHFSPLQVFLRQQTTNKVSFDFISIIVDYMNMLLNRMSIIKSEDLDDSILNLYYNRIISCLETLCELIQGPCYDNQVRIINSKILEIFDKILRETEFTEVKTQRKNINFFENENPNLENLEDVKKINYSNANERKLFGKLCDFEKSFLIYKIGLVLLAVIEGRMSKDVVVQKLMRDFDYKLLLIKLTELFLKISYNTNLSLEYFVYTKKDTKGKIVLEAGFNLYILLSSLYSYETLDTEFKKTFSYLNSSSNNSSVEKEINIETEFDLQYIKSAVVFYKNNCLHIEILKDDLVQTVYFPKLNFFKYLTQSMLLSFRLKANRSTIQSKLNSILNVKEDYYNATKLLYQLEASFSKVFFMKYLFLYPNLFFFLSVTLGIIMNILILLSYRIDVDLENSNMLKRISLAGLDYKSIYF